MNRLSDNLNLRFESLVNSKRCKTQESVTAHLLSFESLVNSRSDDWNNIKDNA